MEVLTYSQNQKYETILFSSERRFILKLIKYRISGYLLKPINAEALRNTVELAIHRIEYSQKNTPIRYQTSPPSVIGIPTMDGYEFITIANIIRCESYLKCTRVITTDRPDIISSYNIGEFIKVLEGKAFYRSHQSHLINLNKVKTYLKEGTIIMQDNSSVPVSRRKRAEFLKAIPHL
ncbi:MAG: response regulator transcription factor [Bacteroidota bacterium]